MLNCIRNQVPMEESSKPVCQVCRLPYIQISYIIRHARGNPLKCELCDNAFFFM